MRLKVLSWSRTVKQLVVIALDVVLGFVATWFAFTLRLDTPHIPTAAQWWFYGLAPILAIPVFARFGLYRAIFRYSGQAALVATAKAMAVYSAILITLLLLMQWNSVPRSLGILQPLIFFGLVASSRAVARFLLNGWVGLPGASTGRLLIFGAGTSGVQTAVALSVSRQFRLLGFIDDDPAKIGRSINGLPVWPAQTLSQRVVDEEITDILLAMPKASRQRRNAIIESLTGLPVHVRTVPSMSDLASGEVTVQDVRELDLEDLLGRSPVAPDVQLLARDLAGRVVMVTGAGGSIGSELARHILVQAPRKLVLLDHHEYSLYAITQELEALRALQGLAVDVVALLGSVTDAEHMRTICQHHRPSTVYHAAAYKHVPLVEANVAQGVLNNVFGTLHMAQAARAAGVRRFVLISTDKAVRPTNVMGATKRMAELVLQALAAQAQVVPADPHPSEPGELPSICFSMVRFGNVLGSSGSVVPLFRQQLAHGGPITLTHPDVTRYFMTIPEAVQLVLQAGTMCQGGDVFVLDMGEPVKIFDLAVRMVHLSGLSVRDSTRPDGDIEISVTGLRPGEKLYEELLIGDNPEPTAHPRILRAREAMLPWDALQAHLDRLHAAARSDDHAAMRAVLSACVQGFGAHAAVTMR